MRIFWALNAEQDRADIVDFIAQDNPRAAVRMDELFVQAAGRLSAQPLLGKPGHVPGTREFIVHESYRLVYESRQIRLWILALVHTARLWPRRNP